MRAPRVAIIGGLSRRFVEQQRPLHNRSRFAGIYLGKSARKRRIRSSGGPLISASLRRAIRSVRCTVYRARGGSADARRCFPDARQVSTYASDPTPPSEFAPDCPHQLVAHVTRTVACSLRIPGRKLRRSRTMPTSNRLPLS